MNIRSFLLLILLSCGLVAAVSAADEEEASSATEQEGQEEEKKEEKPDTGGKFLPLPIIITEPAIGEGLGAALIYFHADNKAAVPRVASAATLNRSDRKQTPPPTATGVFAFYTNNDTRGFGIGHARTFKDDKYRLTAMLADATINATYYLGDAPFEFSLDGTIAFARLKRRFGASNMFIGAATSILDASIDFPINPEPPSSRGPGIPEVPFTDVGISGSFIYDSRDDTMMPTTGQLAELSLWRYDEAFGGDYNYTKATLKMNSFHALGKKFVLGLRLEASTANGDVPFYAAPFVKLRGIPALRYQGQMAGVAEVELRYQLAKRWSVLGFLGEGFTDERGIWDETDDEIKAYGVGFRWLALQTKNVWVGLDLARGPEDDFFYIQLVHPW
jgi:hypothetical protein